jgi:uncharacterized membrane protein
MKSFDFVLITTETFVALMAGLLFSYSVSVNLGLGKLADAAYLKAMQSINESIQNPLFFIVFLGALFILPLATILSYNHQKSMFLLLFFATLSYVIGVFGVTIFGNVPLNNQLAKFNLMVESIENIKQQRVHFEENWNYFHQIRTFFSVISLVLVICACVFKK